MDDDEVEFFVRLKMALLEISWPASDPQMLKEG
jgi:hypothetical protein